MLFPYATDSPVAFIGGVWGGRWSKENLDALECEWWAIFLAFPSHATEFPLFSLLLKCLPCKLALHWQVRCKCEKN